MFPPSPAEAPVKEDVVLSAKMTGRARITNKARRGQEMILRPQGIVHEPGSKAHIRRIGTALQELGRQRAAIEQAGHCREQNEVTSAQGVSAPERIKEIQARPCLR